LAPKQMWRTREPDSLAPSAIPQYGRQRPVFKFLKFLNMALTKLLNVVLN